MTTNLDFSKIDHSTSSDFQDKPTPISTPTSITTTSTMLVENTPTNATPTKLEVITFDYEYN
jgi:hypothetical protein